MAVARVRTVRGDVHADALGAVDIHEHLAAPASRRALARDADRDLSAPERVLEDLRAFAAAGGATVVDMTTVDYGRDLDALRRLSAESGVHVVSATGFNTARYARDVIAGADARTLARRQVLDVESGCGLVKFGTSLDTIEPAEETAARAAARTHLETGVPISTHTEAGTMALAQLDLLERCDVSPAAVVIGHLDRNPDLALHRAIIRRGAFVAYDQLPKPKYGTLGDALANIVALAREGLHEQIVLGGDLSRRSYYSGWGGSPGLAFLVTTFRDRLREALDGAGLDAERIAADLLVHNPARALALREP